MLVASQSVGKITKVSKSTSYATGNMDGIRPQDCENSGLAERRIEDCIFVIR